MEVYWHHQRFGDGGTKSGAWWWVSRTDPRVRGHTGETNGVTDSGGTFGSNMGHSSRAKRPLGGGPPRANLREICRGMFTGGKTAWRGTDSRRLRARPAGPFTRLPGKMLERRSVRYDGRAKDARRKARFFHFSGKILIQTSIKVLHLNFTTHRRNTLTILPRPHHPHHPFP